eukprot:jgi/Astpho2/8135/e_gw1.00120.119.1_t
MQLGDDRLSVTSRKGYRMARATHGTFRGCYYYEVKVTHLGSSGHARVGWATRKGELQAPVGYDAHSFAYRDSEGSKVHKSLREDFGESFGEGDVIGCLLYMPEGGRTFEKDKSDIVVWKGDLYFVDKPEPNPEQLKGSLVAFAKNGVLQGTAYRDLKEGTYCPAVSLYTLPDQAEGATVTLNFGPDFHFNPPPVEGCPPAKPISDLSTQGGDVKIATQHQKPLVLACKAPGSCHHD